MLVKQYHVIYFLCLSLAVCVCVCVKHEICGLKMLSSNGFEYIFDQSYKENSIHDICTTCVSMFSGVCLWVCEIVS